MGSRRSIFSAFPEFEEDFRPVVSCTEKLLIPILLGWVISSAIYFLTVLSTSSLRAPLIFSLPVN